MGSRDRALSLQDAAHQGQPSGGSSSGPSGQPRLEGVQERLACTRVCATFPGRKGPACCSWVLRRVCEPPKRRSTAILRVLPSHPAQPQRPALGQPPSLTRRVAGPRQRHTVHSDADHRADFKAPSANVTTVTPGSRLLQGPTLSEGRELARLGSPCAPGLPLASPARCSPSTPR